ncbi:hypothetical protein N2152v2_001054 [Parachlorella kessleri]
MRAVTILLCCTALFGLRLPQVGADSAGGSQPVNNTQTLPAFNAISLCMPINLYVVPNTTANATYSITIEAEPQVADAITYSVTNGTSNGTSNGTTNGTLSLGTAGKYRSALPVKVTVSLPADALQRIDHHGVGAEVFVGPGFNVSNFTAYSSQSAGDLTVLNMTSAVVNLTLAGVGGVYLTGSFGTVDLEAGSTGNAYIVGVNGTVNLSLGGTSKAYIQPGLSSAKISGVAGFINGVEYTQGTCSVPTSLSGTADSSIMPSDSCKRVDSIDLPEVKPLEGNFTCAGHPQDSMPTTPAIPGDGGVTLPSGSGNVTILPGQTVTFFSASTDATDQDDDGLEGNSQGNFQAREDDCKASASELLMWQ